mgnify:CR=1 FL=1
MNFRNKLAFILATTITLSGCVIGNQYGHSGRDVDVTLGNIEVEDGENAGHLDTVNGNIDIGRQALVKSAETVNGNIVIGDDSSVGDLETVNGSIELGKNVTVNGAIETVNGDIVVEENGRVTSNLTTTNGDITLASKTHIEGDIIFEHSKWASMFEKQNHRTLEIAADVTIDGYVYLYSPVNLSLPSSFDKEKIKRRYEGKK